MVSCGESCVIDKIETFKNYIILWEQQVINDMQLLQMSTDGLDGEDLEMIVVLKRQIQRNTTRK